eukprot:CAMPEP_0168225776 /NCGR_PEP_ID=MMETSP0140_2-20121125/12953_1 /TAXON_ID=44445 /ORGANISM="Pseudo-nitzschia australis, Strain 10249 10 AB" /LENGTH=154 /DNA_ID=CAMNT_0008156605 /DNA_START=83 /DNA_END=547 /DNA_ORIENTATION=-
MTDEMKILPQGDSRSSGDAQNKNNFIDIDLVKAQNFASHAIGNDEYSNDLLFLERVLEDDLTSQLNALQDDMPDPYLFRYPDGDNGANFDTETKAKADPIPSPNIFHEASDQDNVTKRKSLNLYGELVEEGVLESLAICAMLGFLMMTTPEHFL